MKDVLVSRATGGGRYYGGEAGLPLRGNWWEDEVCLIRVDVDVHQTDNIGLLHAGKDSLTEIIFKLITWSKALGSVLPALCTQDLR